MRATNGSRQIIELEPVHLIEIVGYKWLQNAILVHLQILFPDECDGLGDYTECKEILDNRGPKI